MTQLSELLLAPTKRPIVVGACAQLVRDEVGRKSGLSGMAVKAAFKIVNKVKPGIIEEAVDALLDEFVSYLAPFYDGYLESPQDDMISHFSDQSAAVADALLGVTDTRIQRARNRSIAGAYRKLRPKGQQYVQEAVPGIARVLAVHT